MVVRGIDYALRLLLVIGILLLNVRLYLPPASNYTHERLGDDVIAQLHFIRSALQEGAGPQMQQLFPEGYFFTHVLYGLAWVEVGMRQPPDTPLHTEALHEARWVLTQLDTPAGRAPFAPSLEPPFGVFYNGWSSWLRGAVLMLQPPERRDAAEVARFITDCTALAAAFDRSPTPFLSAYPGQSWPVDNVVAIAALRLHDTLLPPRFTATIDRWIDQARTQLDPSTGLLAHSSDPASGQPRETARGSSQSIIARFLVEIDPEWGRADYARFREQFVTTVGGVPGVREYPVGIDGPGDVDSGPLLFGISLSATTVTLGAALLHNDRELSDALLHASEATGLPLEWGGGKRYAFGLLPVGDAFLVWSKTARPWIAPPPAPILPPVVAGWWRLPYNAVSLLLVLLLVVPIVCKGKPRTEPFRTK